MICAAYAHELPRYGLKTGLTNYAAGYCVGLLVARRLLQQFKLDKDYEGNVEASGEDYNVEHEGEGPKPFSCLLDIGLARTTTGAKVFGVLKGALDGGLDIPHSEKRFVGYDRESKALEPEALKKYIFGGHVAEYMEHLKEEDGDKYGQHFARLVKEGLEAGDLEDLYRKVHSAIRADPAAKPNDHTKPDGAPDRFQTPKLTYDERKERLRQRMASMMEADEE